VGHHVPIVIARAAASLVALLVCAWFALGARQAVDTSRASALLGGGRRLTAREAARARSLLSSAGTLNPDRSVELLRGQLAVDQHRYAVGERIFETVTRSEPLNLQAWDQLTFAAGSAHDTATLAVAIRHIRQLYPKRH
jgi:hypothetical protein